MTEMSYELTARELERIGRKAASTEGKRTGEYRYGFAATDKTLKLKISRADVADFMLKQLVDDTYVHHTPGLSY